MEQALEQPRLVQIDPPGVQEAWQMVMGQLRLEMKQALFESWVEPLLPQSFKEGVFRLNAVNPYAREWVDGHLRSRITRLLEGVYNQPVSVSLGLVKNSSGQPVASAPEQALVQTGQMAEKLTEKDTIPSGGELAPEKLRPNGQKKPRAANGEGEASPRKIQLQRAYGTERARVIQPERGMFLTMYFFSNWLPLIGHSAAATVLAARSLCYWNPMTGEMRNVVETDMSDLAKRASVSLRTIKDVLNNELVKRFFLRYKVRRVMTPNGVRTAGIILQVRMDDPLTPEDQDVHNLPEEERWYTAGFEDESED